MRALALAWIVLLSACGPDAPTDTIDAPIADPPDAMPPECPENDTRCVAGGIFQRCQQGMWSDEETCTGSLVCVSDLGCSQCDPAAGSVCSGQDVVECTEFGTFGAVIMTCGATQDCRNGICVDPCAAAAMDRSYIGCEYWAVDLDNAVEVVAEVPSGFGCDLFGVPGLVGVTMDVCYNPTPPGIFDSTVAGMCDYGADCSAAPAGYQTCTARQVCILDAQHSPFAVVVSNPDSTRSVTVTLENLAGDSQSYAIAPGAVQPIFPQMNGFADQSLEWSAIEDKAYRLTSTRPIVAYQFNPLDNVNVFSNDASLLLPSHTFDTSYYVVTHATLPRRVPIPGETSTHDLLGYATVVASAPGVTTVTVELSADVRGGPNVPDLAGSSTQMFMLDQYQTLNLEADSGDLTGTRITADQPFGLFGGHEATAISQTSPPPCCADHLEDQLFPTSTWGKSYVVGRSQPRTPAVADLVRVIAQTDATAVTFNPATGGGCPLIDAGEICDVFINSDVEITSDQPILVAHYLLSAGGMSQGDPSLSYAVPTEQYRTDYTILVPAQYTSNYITLVAPAAGTVMLDTNDVTGQLVAFGSGSYKTAKISVPAGQHHIVCPSGCGVEVYGYSLSVSYMFAGGLDLRQIVVE
jgi:hypothetical protein